MSKKLLPDDRHKILFVMQDEVDLTPFFFLVFDSPFYKSIMEILVEANLMGASLKKYIMDKFNGNFINAQKFFEQQARVKVQKMQS